MQSQLYELCSQFEQIFVASLVPKSVFRMSDSQPDEPSADSGISALFAQSLAAALERAGGLGLGREIYRLLSESHV